MILIVGVPFTGKTVSAATFPKPMLFLDYDSGFESVKHTKDISGNLVVPDWKEIEVISLTYNEVFDINLNSPSESDFKLGKFPPHTKNSFALVEKFNSIIKELFVDGCVTINGEKKGPFKSLIIDPLTTVFKIWQDGILYANRLPGLRLTDYKTLERILFSQFLPTLKSLEKKIPWIISIVHETVDKDELLGTIKEFPIGPSKQMGKTLAKDFSEVFRMKIEGKRYMWRTKNTGRFEGAGSRFDLPDPLPATFKELEKYLKKEVR